MKNHFSFLIAILLLSALTGCQLPPETSSAPMCSSATVYGTDDSVGTLEAYCSSAGLAETPEIAECTTSSVYASPAVVSGTATFYKRDIDFTAVSSTVTEMTLGAPISAPLPIKYAEVRVLNGSGTVVQCGKTDSNGALKAVNGTDPLNIPNTAGTYTVQVLARAQHTVSVGGGKTPFKLYTAIKEVCTNNVHKISTTINSSGTGTYNTSLVAYAKESQSASIEGGAFNILNSLAVTYDYLAQNTGTSNLTCLNPKLHIYWKAGFNPNQFIDPYTDPSTLGTISYYLRGYNELYINGGKLGDVSSADTDHFDDSVIIHEIGHHLESVCGKMESPGGTHYGQFRIDPRLAWSEGWGNFLGAHIIRNNLASINPDLNTALSGGYDGWLYYLDTSGYRDGAAQDGEEAIRFNLSKPGSNPEFLGTSGGYPFYYDRVNSTNYPGEGHFREVSVSRSLFKTTNTCTSTGTCTGLSYFDKMWEAFENDATKSGMGKSAYPFRTSIRFFERLTAVSVSSTLPAAISTMLNSDEAQQLPGSPSYVSGTTTTWVPYATKLISNGSTPCNLMIQPRNEEYNVTYFEPDQRYSNHFYYLLRDAIPSVTDIYLNVTKVSGTSTDIDLVLYGDSYRFPTETCTDENCTSYVKNTCSSQFVRADRSIATADSYSKHISGINSLSAAVPFLLNIRAFTSGITIENSTAYTYTLTDQNGDYLCPSPTY